MDVMMRFNADEIRKQFAYELICMTRESSVWGTMRRRRRWSQEFTEAERKAATEIFRDCHKWTLTTGVPNEKVMSVKRYLLWMKLENFCASL